MLQPLRAKAVMREARAAAPACAGGPPEQRLRRAHLRQARPRCGSRRRVLDEREGAAIRERVGVVLQTVCDRETAIAESYRASRLTPSLLIFPK